jgi:hypothetical protein
MADLEEAPAPTLRSVVLDSAFPPSVYALSALPRNPHDPVLQLLRECRQDQACRTAYPNLEQRLQQLLSQLESAPLAVDDHTIAAARVLTNLTRTRSGYMPKMIAELEQGRIDTYLALRNNEVGTAEPEGSFSLDPSDPVQAFIATALPFVLQGEDLSAAIGFIGSISQVLAEADPLAALQAYIAETFEGAAQPNASTPIPDDVADLQSIYGAPSQAGLGSAVFYKSAVEPQELEAIALKTYHYFVGDLWERWGEAAWMTPWQVVYQRPTEAEPQIVVELESISDANTASSVCLLLTSPEDPTATRNAMAAVYDAATVTDLMVYTIGDGAAMSGLLLGGRREWGDVTFLIFLLD